MEHTHGPVWILVPALVLAASAHAVVRRHDRDDAPYLELARAYPAVCDIGADGNGTLIAPDWVLTAAHVAAGLTPFSARVSFGGTTHGSGTRVHAVDRVVLHPRFGSGQRGPNNDIALLHLSSPVEDIEPVAPSTGRDELGRDIVFVGNGMSGLGNEGASEDDRLRRAATNTVHEVSATTLEFVFRAPGEASELEGFWAPGDSGGPVFLEVGGEPRLAGIASFGGDTNDSGKHPDYGDRDVSYRMSSYLDWIEETLAADGEDGARWLPPEVVGDDGIEDERAAGLVAEYVDARSSGDPELRGFFEDAWIDPAAFDMEQLGRDLWLEGRIPRELGELRTVGIARRADDSELAVLLRTPFFDEALCVLFRFSDEDPERLSGVRGVPPLPGRVLPPAFRRER